MTGKISRLPLEIREQLNHRLADGQTGALILPWLNSLPEVQAILNDHFDSQPIDDGNLHQYRKRAFREWQMQRAALEFAVRPAPAGSQAAQLAVSPLLERLVQYISLRLAAAAQPAPIPEDPEADLREIRSFVTDIVSLRRGDLISRRISLEEQRLAAVRHKNKEELDALFWQWTKRPDIQARLYPHRDPDKIRRDVVDLLDRQLLGRTGPPVGMPEPEPACFI
jgi:hypothetical protein